MSSNAHHITSDPGTEECVVNDKWLTNSFKLEICFGFNDTSIFNCNWVLLFESLKRILKNGMLQSIRRLIMYIYLNDEKLITSHPSKPKLTASSAKCLGRLLCCIHLGRLLCWKHFITDNRSLIPFSDESPQHLRDLGYNYNKESSRAIKHLAINNVMLI